jgi:hypothetical protein
MHYMIRVFSERYNNTFRTRFYKDISRFSEKFSSIAFNFIRTVAETYETENNLNKTRLRVHTLRIILL